MKIATLKISGIIVAALVVAVPAMAASVADAQPVKATYDAKHDKYCVSQEVTGQRIPVRDCRTKAEWAAAGAAVGDAKQAGTTKLARR